MDPTGVFNMFDVVEVKNPSLNISISLPHVATKNKQSLQTKVQRRPYNNGRGGILFDKIHTKYLEGSKKISTRRPKSRATFIDQSQYISKLTQASLLQESARVGREEYLPSLIKPIPLKARELFWTPNRQDKLTWVESYSKDKPIFVSPITHYANKLSEISTMADSIGKKNQKVDNQISSKGESPESREQKLTSYPLAIRTSVATHLMLNFRVHIVNNLRNPMMFSIDLAKENDNHGVLTTLMHALYQRVKFRKVYE